MEDKREVRGLEYDEGEWTGRYFQPLLLCKHRREELIEVGWFLEETSMMFTGEGCTPRNFVPIGQKCEHEKA